MKILALAMVLALSACATGEKLRTVSIGMTVSDVRQVLGSPDGVRSVEGHEVYTYTNKLISGWSWDRADYNVIFRDGRVVEYGAGEVRPGPKPMTVFIVPLRGI